MRIIVEARPPGRMYIGGRMQPVEVVFRLSDGWRLMATSLQDAIDEAAEYGVEITGVEPEH